MGKKKRGHPDVEEVLARPWCYYCERDFEDLKLLISHQKAKHFKCDRCHRRLNTAGGLSVHLNQVHKETLQQVENSLPNRQSLDVEIFGMEGIPADILEQHRNRIIQNFYQAQETRRIATGNPLPGQSSQVPRKKIQYETEAELLARFREWRVKRKAEREAMASGVVEGAVPGPENEQAQNAQHARQQAYEAPHGYVTTSTIPGPPVGSLGPPPGLPQRPEGGPWHAAPADDIDKMIRMAEAGVKPAAQTEEGTADDGKKAKKEKKARLYYDAADVSPEEKMAMMPRYALGAAA
ncbi:hypothetical protein RJ55_01699 [Drechmeria coniospora]|nr:hypothetical protein RJ55_01699 [Drechmeria coniospora]